MIAICVDDEKLPLQALERAINKSPDITETKAFTDEIDAIEWAGKHPVDIAFLDIELHVMDGIALAKELKALQPQVSIVFCTSYEQYALQAIKLHMDVGYLIKPFRDSQIQEEIDHAKERRSGAPKLTAVCFGNFEVYVGGKPVKFRRTKTKELLAYLVSRRGAEVSAGELCAVLWEEAEDDEKKRDYLYHLIADLKNSLNQVGVGDAFITKSAGYAVDTECIDCDYYSFLEGDPKAKRNYAGEYMHQYSWGETTNAWIGRDIG